MRTLAIIAPTAMLLIGIAIGYNAPRFEPGLIGFGCTGTNGPIYAHEESDFPQCDEILPVSEVY